MAQAPDGVTVDGGGREATPLPMSPELERDLLRVFGDVALERLNQVRKWGVQRHPSIDPHTAYQCAALRIHGKNYPADFIDARANGDHTLPSARVARMLCEAASRDGRLSWVHILLEELCEAVEAVAQYGEDSTEARTEVVQTAAVAIAWLESLDSRRAAL